MQRHAVHRRRHAVFANAVMDEAAAVIVGARRHHALGAGVVGAGEVGRAAEHFRHRRRQHFDARFSERCGSRCSSATPRVSLLVRAHRLGQRLAAACPSCGARIRRACAASARRTRLRPVVVRGRAARTGRAPARECLPEFRTAAQSQPSFLLAPAISSAPSGEPCDFSEPALVGAP